MVPAKRRYPLIGHEPKTEGGESCQLRPREEWIPIPVPDIVSTELFGGAKQRLAQNRQWATRNTKGEYLLRCLLSCGRCGLAHHVWNNGRYVHHRCRGMDTLINRHTPDACHARLVPRDRLDAVVWADVCAVLTEPSVLDEALTRAQRGWLTSDERNARLQDLQHRQHEVQRQMQRLIDAYTAGIIDLEELGARRGKLEERLAALRRE
jgi:site-specific DNA recombinase